MKGVLALGSFLVLSALLAGALSQSQMVRTSTPQVAVDFQQLNQTATPLRVIFAKRTDWYHENFPPAELRASFPDKDVVVVLLLEGITPEELNQVRDQQPAEGIGTMYIQTADTRRVFNLVSSGTINGKPRIMLATTVPRNAAEIRIVIGDIAPAVVRLNGPVLSEVTSTRSP